MNIKQYKTIIVVAFILFLYACSNAPQPFVLQGNINGGQNSYIKIMDMTNSGFPIDSILLDATGHFVFERLINEPKDYVLYFKPEQSIRITPLPTEKISLSANAGQLMESYSVQGSVSSAKICEYTKYLQKLRVELDSVSAFYMRNQYSENIDTIVKIAKKRSDSLFNLGKKYLQDVIRSNPSGMESYVALAQKFTYQLNFFTLENDMPYFTMVDTAFTNHYDTARVALMLNNYVRVGQHRNKLRQETQHLQIGSYAPQIKLPNPYGDTLSLEKLHGKYVLIDFWGSWCRPCRKENKNLLKAYNRFKRYGFEVFQIALEYDKQNWKNAIREDHLWWRNQVSELKYMDSKVAKSYKTQQIPANFLIDREGKIIAINLYGDRLTAKLDELFLKQAKK